MSGHHSHKDPLLEEIEHITSQNTSMCYQCGKCSAGCPIRDFADESPNKIIRYIQLGLYEKALKSKTIWLCASCQTCTTRCPQKYDLARLMDALRQLAIKKGYKPDRAVYKFHKAFLKQIKDHGRSYELGLVRDYKLSNIASLTLFQDMDVAPTMLLKGKLGILPHNIKGKKAIEKMFKKYYDKKGDE